jgi:2-polyprenyl-3-methyl-5-hydroxy-6-metoxy-1,4-benzoquinol methylase
MKMRDREPRVPISKGPSDTSDEEYTRRLEVHQLVWWKQLLRVQAPYQWNLRRLKPGITLEIGCGIGRNLVTLGPGSVGVDHNASSVTTARSRGFVAFSPEELRNSEYSRPGSFDSLLVAHVLEHLTTHEAESLVAQYIDLIRPLGTLILITPQEVGFRSDASHKTFMDFTALAALCESVGARVERQFSFPFPRRVGRVFIYNEFVVLARLPDKSD